VDLSDYDLLKNKIEKKQQLIEKHSRQLKNLYQQCPHIETKTESTYYSGSYTDPAYTETSQVCALCRKVLAQKTTEHSWFG
jgi:hypothetical protein